MPRIDVFLDHHARDRTGQRIGLIDAAARAAVQFQSAARARELGRRARLIGLGDVYIFACGDAVLFQLAQARNIFLRQRVIAFRAPRVALRLAKIRRSNHRQRLPLGDGLANLHQDALDAPRERRVHAHRFVFIPGDAAIQMRRRHRLHIDDQRFNAGDLRRAREENDALAFGACFR